MNEHAVLQLLVLVGDVQQSLTGDLNEVTAGMSSTDKREVIDAMEHLRTGIDETEHRLRIMLMNRWGESSDRVEHIATRTTEISSVDVPTPWARYRPDRPQTLSSRPPTIMELVTNSGDTSRDD